ncbi:spore germination protein GerPE [Ectobacillus polymachus]|uniref:spore germination protein GerPE n=1 Tax=Ectobacillus polymachus TaxID=1508806 RepID=UPI003A8BB079
MMKRFSVVDEINISSLGIDAVAQLGDTNTIHAKSRGIAIQQESDQYSIDETPPLASYPLFLDTEITIPTRRKEVRMHTIQECPFIHINQINMTYIQGAAVFHIGNVEYTFSNNRLLQIRHLIK